MATAMGKRLDGKTILVTGASSGIGKATALEFARTSPKNLKLILTARRFDSLKQVAEEIKAEVGEGVRVLPIQLDVSKKENIDKFIVDLPEEFKEIDILVNNAGLVRGVAKAPEIAAEDLEVMFNTNVHGLIHMTQAVLPIFQKRPDGGRGDIINLGSIAGREAYPGGSIYCATKAAVRSFTDALRKELVATRIRVIEIDPGQVETVRDIAPPSTFEHDINAEPSRSFPSCDFMEIKPRLMLFMRKLPFRLLPSGLPSDKMTQAN
ncbi:hypothetical protein FQN49_001264 [Arthroderma sp. PD_2]|nr:hypothetical protein FQN49_001264 [Arthroderma sp. PD_2]